MQRYILCFLVFLAFSSSWADGVSAYQALQIVRQNRPGLGKLIEMRGERGEPQPQQWTLLFDDSSARGGVREVVVTSEGIASERTPLTGFAGMGSLPTVEYNQLKLDSDAAFRIANGQAEKRQLGFNWIDYTLRVKTVDSGPIWVLKLFDHMGAPVGVIQISAVNSSIIAPLELADHPRRDEDTDRSDPVTKPIDGIVGGVSGFTKRTAKKVSNTTLRFVGTVEEIFTGERTIGPPEEEEENE